MWETMATWKIEESDEQKKFHKKIRALENKIPGKSYQAWIQYYNNVHYYTILSPRNHIAQHFLTFNVENKNVQLTFHNST